jgi:CheY-like chemotaxis protein
VSRASILIVDDDPSMIRWLGRMLSSLGSVQFATDGEEALNLMRSGAPDVVLLDAELPGISGTGLCRMIKADPELANVVCRAGPGLTGAPRRGRVRRVARGARQASVQARARPLARSRLDSTG